MEFERAIYRVYEKCLEGLREDDAESISPRSCRFMEYLILVTALFLLFSLNYLHFQFVGSSGCLPHHLQLYPNPRAFDILVESNNSSFSNETYDNSFTALNLRQDQILQINVKGSFMTSASSSAQGQDEEVSIVHGLSSYFRDIYRLVIETFHHGSSKSLMNFENQNYMLTEFERRFPFSSFLLDANDESSSHPASKDGKSTRRYSHAHGYDYEFGFNIGLLAIPQGMRDEHDFKTFNVTLTGRECFGNYFTMTLLPLGGVDTVIKNYLQSTFMREGVLIASTGDYYTWSKQDIRVIHSLSFGEKFYYKIMVLIMSLFSFFFVSTITALLVRILISSGVVLLFPMFWMIQRAGVSAISWRLVSLSYPWIGVPIEILRARNQSAVPFVMAHIVRIVVYYTLYEAAQFAFSSWFYGEIRPGQRELWIFAIMMILEYYSMIYVRARASIIVFPRATLALYLLLHFYIYCAPSGFHLLAILVVFVFYVWLMVFCVRKFELDAFLRGQVSIDQPRVLHNSLPWPVWSIALAPDFTLFWPLDSESTSIYGVANEGNRGDDGPSAGRATDANLANDHDPEIGAPDSNDSNDRSGFRPTRRGNTVNGENDNSYAPLSSTSSHHGRSTYHDYDDGSDDTSALLIPSSRNRVRSQESDITVHQVVADNDLVVRTATVDDCSNSNNKPLDLSSGKSSVHHGVSLSSGRAVEV